MSRFQMNNSGYDASGLANNIINQHVGLYKNMLAREDYAQQLMHDAAIRNNPAALDAAQRYYDMVKVPVQTVQKVDPKTGKSYQQTVMASPFGVRPEGGQYDPAVTQAGYAEAKRKYEAQQARDAELAQRGFIGGIWGKLTDKPRGWFGWEPQQLNTTTANLGSK